MVAVMAKYRLSIEGLPSIEAIRLDDLSIDDLPANFYEIPLKRGCLADVKLHQIALGTIVTVNTPLGHVSGALRLIKDEGNPLVSRWRIEW